MTAENIAIGDELLLGQTINTNSAWIGENLASVGIPLTWITVVGDVEGQIEDALRTAWSRADVILTTGGLGPTNDDITLKAVNQFFGGKLVMDNKVLQNIQERFRTRGIVMPKINENQALVPDNSRVIDNDVGTAPGFLYERENKIAVVMPGVPREMKSMMERVVLPFLQGKNPHQVIRYQVLKTTGIIESALYEMMEKDIPKLESLVTLAFLPSHTGVNLRLTVQDSSEEKARDRIAQAEKIVRSHAENWIYAAGKEELEETIGKMLAARHLTLAIAESCTGGLVADRITNVPGSSKYFIRGYVTYSNESKMSLLNVPGDLISKFGSVSEECAKAMAEGVRTVSQTDIGVSTTGIAGPDGGSSEKPVGLVYVAVSFQPKGKPGKTVCQKFNFPGDRRMNKERAAQAAMNLIRKILMDG